MPRLFYHHIPQQFNIVMFRNILHFLLSLWFGVLLILSSHFARAFHELQCTVRVISAAKFENTRPVHSANFENGMETGLNIQTTQTQSLFHIIIGNLTSDRRSFLQRHFILPKKHFNHQTHLEKKTAVIIWCCYRNHTTNY